jgi:hypothetical protein
LRKLAESWWKRPSFSMSKVRPIKERASEFDGT